MDKHCKDQQRVIEEIKFKNKILSEDRDYYEEFVIETKKENKALKTELVGFYTQQKAKSPKHHEKPYTAETDARRSRATDIKDKDSFFQTQPLKVEAWGSKNLTGDKMLDEVKRLKEAEEKYIQKINQLNNQIEKDRLLLRYNLYNFMDIINNFIRKIKNEEIGQEIKRAELEKILIDCVNEVRKDIIKRKSIMFLRENSKTLLNIEEIDFSKFSVSDKK